jgi:hypothetical protein
VIVSCLLDDMTGFDPFFHPFLYDDHDYSTMVAFMYACIACLATASQITSRPASQNTCILLR